MRKARRDLPTDRVSPFWTKAMNCPPAITAMIATITSRFLIFLTMRLMSILGQENLSHAPLADLFDDLVVGKVGSNHSGPLYLLSNDKLRGARRANWNERRSLLM